MCSISCSSLLQVDTSCVPFFLCFLLKPRLPLEPVPSFQSMAMRWEMPSPCPFGVLADGDPLVKESTRNRRRLHWNYSVPEASRPAGPPSFSWLLSDPWTTRHDTTRYARGICPSSGPLVSPISCSVGGRKGDGASAQSRNDMRMERARKRDDTALYICRTEVLCSVAETVILKEK